MPEPKRTPPPYYDRFLTELFRYAKLHSMNPNEFDEYDAAVFAVWYTQGSDDVREENEFGGYQIPDTLVHLPKRGKGMGFTVHTHPGKPLTASPDDEVIYERLKQFAKEHGEEYEIANFLVDGFSCRRVKPEDEK